MTTSIIQHPKSLESFPAEILRRSQRPSFRALPSEIILSIFSFLSPSERIDIGAVNTRWRYLTTQPSNSTDRVNAFAISIVIHMQDNRRLQVRGIIDRLPPPVRISTLTRSSEELIRRNPRTAIGLACMFRAEYAEALLAYLVGKLLPVGQGLTHRRRISCAIAIAMRLREQGDVSTIIALALLETFPRTRAIEVACCIRSPSLQTLVLEIIDHYE